MPLVDEAIDEIATKISAVSDPLKDEWEILADVVAAEEANPESQGTVERELDPYAILNFLSDAHKVAVVKYQAQFNNLMTAIQNGDRVTAKAIILQAVNAGVITTAEAIAIRDYCDETILDPDWQAQIPWVVYRFGRRLTIEEIKQALNRLS